MGGNSVTIIIPTKNESKTVLDILKACKVYNYNILVVDGHSTDGTRKLIESFGVDYILDNKRGKGAALRLAVDKVKTEIVVFLDADGSHNTADIPKLLSPIIKGKADIVIASRTLGGSAELSGNFDKLLRRFFSWSIDTIINLRFRSHITDAQNGFRAIRREVFLNLNLKENVFSIEQEMVMKCLKKNYNICEVPSYEHARKHGSSNISLFRHGPKYMWCILKNIW